MQQLQTVLLQQIKNGEHHWSLERIASTLHLTERTLQRKIKFHTQLTVGQYLQEFRLQYAHQALQRKQYVTIREVVYALGYTNPSYFAKIFKKRFGYNPKAFANKAERKSGCHEKVKR